jgi:O-methyltransferase
MPIRSHLSRLVHRTLHGFGIDVIRVRNDSSIPSPADVPAKEDREIMARVAPYTMTSWERQEALIHAVRYIVRRGISGCFVECGVWRGGSIMAMTMALAQEGETTRHLYLYDTFEGMTPPADVDRAPDGTLARTFYDREVAKKEAWCFADLKDVQRNIGSLGYPADRVHFIKGPVAATIPAQSPAEPIALLRLDTDWYESTRHELIHLFPALVDGGVLIIDDYGYWQGARKAVDEYLGSLSTPYYLHRIDPTGRVLQKI